MRNDKHMVIFYREIEDADLNNCLCLIAKKKFDVHGNQVKYDIGNQIEDINTKAVYTVIARDEAHNNIMVLKQAGIKITPEERKLLKEQGLRKDKVKPKPLKIKLNLNTQVYKGIPLRLIDRKDYHTKNAMRYIINETNQNIWIPKCYLKEDGTIKSGVNLSFIFNTKQFQNKLKKAYDIRFEE